MMDATVPNDSERKIGLIKLSQLIKDFHLALLTTIDPDGNVRTRPMAAHRMDDDGILWFFTARSSGKVHSIESDQRVNVAYASPSDTKFVSVLGWAEIVQDPVKAAQLWHPMFRSWFPAGLEDPELSLIKVHVEEAEYWDSPSGKSQHLLRHRPQAVSVEHHEVEFPILEPHH